MGVEWKIYLKHKNKDYRILKLRQGANFDITVIPKNAVLFSREIIKNLNFDDQIQLNYESLGGQIDHYSAHSRTGQRHIKLDANSPAVEPTTGLSFDDSTITKAIPLMTMVAAANAGSEEKPSSGKWYGYQLADDVNYLIMELFAVPKNSLFEFQQSFLVKNEKSTLELFDHKQIEMRNCSIVVNIRTTTHELTDIPNNVVFQQIEGKSVNIVRVEKGTIFAQVSHLISQ